MDFLIDINLGESNTEEKTQNSGKEVQTKQNKFINNQKFDQDSCRYLFFKDLQFIEECSKENDEYLLQKQMQSNDNEHNANFTSQNLLPIIQLEPPPDSEYNYLDILMSNNDIPQTGNRRLQQNITPTEETRTNENNNRNNLPGFSAELILSAIQNDELILSKLDDISQFLKTIAKSNNNTE